MSGLAFVRVERARLETTGADRVKFLHNFCTADVRRLTPGQGAEAFLLNVKGKILAYALAYVADDKIVLDCAAQRALPLSAHLDRYTLTDDVAVADVSSDWAQLVLLGQAAEELLTSAIAGEAPRSAHDFRRANLGGAPIELARGSLAGPQSWTLWVAADKAQDVAEQLVALGGRACDAAELEVARIEAGMPLDGVDVTDDNLPQEVNRNAQAISFTKGCYLGQEVVARIDALGHVNRLLVGLKCSGDRAPPAGQAVTRDGAPAGSVTSAAFSARAGRPLALAYVRSALAETGERFQLGDVEAEIAPLPFLDD